MSPKNTHKSIIFVLAFFFISYANSVPVLLDNYNNPLTLSDPAAPGAYYRDRFNPYIFESAPFNGDNRLHVQVNSLDSQANRTSAYSSSFYNTQGRSYGHAGMTYTQIDMFISDDWNTNERRSELWAFSSDSTNTSIGYYPRMGVINDVNGLRFRVADENLQAFVNLPKPVITGQWYTFSIAIKCNAIEFRINGELVYTKAGTDGATSFMSSAVNTYNFGSTYDVYLDNLTVDNENIACRCSDGVDNDSDGVSDMSDPACLDPNQNFETPANTATLGGTVFIDTNKNGVKDPEETTSLPGVAVSLYDLNDVLIASLNSDSNGSYQFTNIPIGNYYLKFTSPVGYIFSSGETTFKSEDISLTADEINLAAVILGAAETTPMIEPTPVPTGCENQSNTLRQLSMDGSARMLSLQVSKAFNLRSKFDNSCRKLTANAKSIFATNANKLYLSIWNKIWINLPAKTYTNNLGCLCYIQDSAAVLNSIRQQLLGIYNNVMAPLNNTCVKRRISSNRALRLQARNFKSFIDKLYNKALIPVNSFPASNLQCN